MMEEAGADGRAKRRKTEASQIRELVQIGASVSAVVRIAARLREHPDLNVIRQTLRSATDSILTRQLFRSHPIRLQRPDKDFEWQLFDPNRLVAHMVETSPKLSSSFREAFAKRACSADSPWHLIVVWDEFVPGNVLSSTNARKTMLLSFSFLELGQEKLWHEECWFSPVVVRSKIMPLTSSF